jgi:hypothetical protein
MGEATKDFMMGLLIVLDWETTGAGGGGSLRRALFLMPADVSMTRFNNATPSATHHLQHCPCPALQRGAMRLEYHDLIRC